MHQPPQGYFAPGADAARAGEGRRRARADDRRIREAEISSPTRPSICAHSRSQQTGCKQCIDVCSTAAIRADGDHIKVEPHLCMGCGACTTVCPSGALTLRLSDGAGSRRALPTLLRLREGRRPRRLLAAARRGRRARAIASLARRGRGLPARVIPLEVASRRVGRLDVWLAALAHGAPRRSRCSPPAREAPQYRAALRFQMRFAEAIANALGYQGEHFRLIDASARIERALWEWPAALPPRVGATFAADRDKRTTLGARDRPSAQHAPVPQHDDSVAGRRAVRHARVNPTRCTMCLACVGSCPEAALLDNAETPQLRFIEANCVQCGLCAATCPEHAITLVPRLDLTPRRAGAAHAERSGDLRLHALRQADGHAKDGLAMIERCAVTRCSPVRQSRTVTDVRRLPRRGLDDEREDRGHP